MDESVDESVDKSYRNTTSVWRWIVVMISVLASVACVFCVCVFRYICSDGANKDEARQPSIELQRAINGTHGEAEEGSLPGSSNNSQEDRIMAWYQATLVEREREEVPLFTTNDT
eukprot:CAMPEP_0202701530 /NCGR_PEP_ID=MMETSP1385-20130828/14623_1 /ASSEMBLY_ACC=CAM_ASM_000861 /TAXON_ID=933848 /ORGANISM="Elphidium margaritaceum" /LENGTH=114 /DNA_ID=CAMNT_0049358975 /DNA_START=38 /DNA_END=382 /DNA_ORIENTATION=-